MMMMIIPEKKYTIRLFFDFLAITKSNSQTLLAECLIVRIFEMA